MAGSLYGSTLTWNADGAGDDGVAIGQVKSFSDVSYMRDIYDVTSSSSTHRDYIAGIPNTSDVTFTCVLDDATPDSPHQSLIADMLAGGDVVVKGILIINIPASGSTFLKLSSNALFLGGSYGASIDDAVTVDVTFRLCGTPTTFEVAS